MVIITGSAAGPVAGALAGALGAAGGTTVLIDERPEQTNVLGAVAVAGRLAGLMGTAISVTDVEPSVRLDAADLGPSPSARPWSPPGGTGADDDRLGATVAVSARPAKRAVPVAEPADWPQPMPTGRRASTTPTARPVPARPTPPTARPPVDREVRVRPTPVAHLSSSWTRPIVEAPASGRPPGKEPGQPLGPPAAGSRGSGDRSRSAWAVSVAATGPAPPASHRPPGPLRSVGPGGDGPAARLRRLLRRR